MQPLGQWPSLSLSRSRSGSSERSTRRSETGLCNQYLYMWLHASTPGRLPQGYPPSGKAVLVVLLITCPLRPAKLRSLDLKVKIEIETAGRNLLQEPGFLRLSIKKRNAGFNGYTSCVGKPGGGRRSKRDKRRLAIGDFSAELVRLFSFDNLPRATLL